MMNTRMRGLTSERGLEAANIDWAAVYAELLPRVYNYFRFRMGDDMLAEDLTAQTFEQAWRGRGRYRRDLGAFSTWIFVLARTIAAGHFRRQRSVREVPLEYFTAQRDESPLEELVQRRSDLARLQVLLSCLSKRERELIELKYGADLTNRAIAHLTGVSESNVGTILHRAVRRLRASWEDEGI